MKDHKMMHIFSRHLMAATIVVILGAIIYSPSISGEFIFDDTDNIVENPIVKDFNFFIHTDRAVELDHYKDLKRRYIGYLSFAVNYSTSGSGTAVYHITNVLIHITNALLVYALVLLTFRTPFLRGTNLAGRSPTVALLAAVLFTAHPVQTQAISYIVQRLASLATLFYLASLVSYLAFRLADKNSKKILFYILSIATAVLGMYTKETVFTLPLSVLMFELFFFTGPVRKRLAWWVPMGVTMLIIPLAILDLSPAASHTARALDESFRIREMSRSQYLLNEFRVLVTYLRLIVFPFNQNLDYSYPIFKSFLSTEVWTSFLLLCLLAGSGIYLFIKSRTEDPGLRVVALSVAWFFLTLSVESTIIPLFVIFEHRIYLPMVGVSVGGATGIWLLYDVLKSPRVRKNALSLIIGVTLAFAAAATARNFVWQSEISLWSDVITKSPNKSRAYSNLGKAYQNAGMIDKAIEQYEASLDAYSFEDYATRIITYVNLGNIYHLKGDDAKAINYMKRSIELNPEYELSYYNLATLYLNMGDASEALAELNTTIEKNPGFAQAYYLSGEALMKLSRPAEAVHSYRRALELDPKLSKARLGLARALEALGTPGGALEQYRQAAREQPESIEAHYQLGNALRDEGNLDEAGNAWKQAVKLDPKHAGALSNLGNYYIIKKNYAMAVQYLSKSLEYDPENAESHYNIALALEALGQTDEVIDHYERFIELAPPEYKDIVEETKAKIRTMK